MKNLIKNLVVISLLSFSVSCDTQEMGCTGYMPPEYFLQNESSHTVSVAFANRFDGVDSVVLFRGEGYRYVDVAIFDILNIAMNRVYYDNRYVLKFNEMQDDRRLYYTHVYNLVEENYLFTFIDDDYRFAVENGVDLEAEK